MNSRRLQHFLAVYEQRSFSRAAEQLHVTKPALTKSIQLLEEELNVKLFERTASGVIPTRYAETLSMHAKMIEAEMSNATREIARLSGAVMGEVKVGVTPSVAAHLLPLTFLRLQAKRPGITFKVTEGMMEQLIPLLRNGELDFVIGGWAPGVYPDLATEFVQREDVLVFAGAQHPLAKESEVPLKALLDFAWLLPPHELFWVQLFEMTFVSNGLQPPNPVVVTNSVSFIKTMLHEDKYLCALPKNVLISDLEAGSVVAIPVSEVAISIDITATYRKRDYHLAACGMFKDVLKSVS